MSDLDYGALMDGEEKRLAPNVRAGATDYGGMMDAEASGQRQRLAASLAAAAKTNPDAYAKVMENARSLGVPVAAVENMPDEAQQKVLMQHADALLKSSPVLARQMSSPEFAKLAHDDTEPLSMWEGVKNAWSRGVKTLQQTPGAINIRSAAADAQLFDEIDSGRKIRPGFTGSDPLGMRFDTTPELRGTMKTERLQSAGESAARIAELEGEKRQIPIDPIVQQAQSAKTFLEFWYWFRQKPLDFIASVGAESIPSSAPGMVAAIPAGIAGGPPGVAAALGTGSLISDYASSVMESLQAEGIDLTDKAAIEQAVKNPELMQRVGARAAAHAVGVATFDAMSGGIAGRNLAPGFIKGTLAKGATNLALQAPVQGTLGALGEAVGSVMAGKEIQAGDVMSEFFGEFAGTPGEVLAASAGKVYGRMRVAEAAVQDAQVLARMTELVKTTKLAARDPQTFADFVQAASEDGPVNTLYMDARELMRTLQQAGLDATTLPEAVRAQIPDAVMVGGDVQMPIGDYTARIAGSDIGAALLPHLKIAPEAMSQKEAQVFMQEQLKTFEQEAERILATPAYDEKTLAGAQAVHQHFMDQLAAANRFTPDVNSAYATLLQQFYTATAQRLGITPQEMLARYPLRVAVERIAGEAVMDQKQGFSAEAYHGQRANGGKSGFQRNGVGRYYSNNEQSAALYTVDPHTMEKTGKVVKEHVALHNPHKHSGHILPQAATEADAQALTDKLVAAGHDGIVIDHGAGIQEYVVFDPAKVLDAAVEKAGEKKFGEIAERHMLNARAKANAEGKTYGEPERQAAMQAAAQEILNPQTFDQSAKRKPVDTKAAPFKKWSDGDPVVGPDDFGSYEGGAAVFRVFHGTTADFTTFDRSKANAESDLGAGFYFTSNPDDVSENYAGEGPDLTGRIERRMEQLFDELDRGERVEIAAKHFDKPYDELSYEEKRVGIREIVKKELSVEHGGMVMPVFVHLKNPVVVSDRNNGTRLTFDEPYDEKTDSYGEPEGTLLPIIEALRNIQTDGEFQDFDAEKVIAEGIFNEHWDGGEINAANLMSNMKLSAGMQYATDSKGDLVSTEIIRQVFERAGYDGFVDYTVDEKFGHGRAAKGGRGMVGMDPDTVHVVAFESSQIKSAIGNSGKFDPNSPNILKQAARGQIAFGGDITQTPSVISLLKNADLSTFIHEVGHFTLEVTAHIASQPDAPAQVIEDMTKVLAWFGVKDLATWRAMSADEQRKHHEKFARGFEAYLFEGKAPSVEMAGLFARFRAWLLNVYRSLAALNVDLTDEVRQVMGRMLAAEDKIREAESFRSYEPIFAGRDQAGMTEQEWQDYQELGASAHETAVTDLERRSLRDMRWASNAKSRALKALQAEGREKRKSIEEEVTAEVRKQPEYAVQRFLKNGELPDGEKVVGAKLSLKALKEMYGEEPAAPWRYIATNMVTTDIGLHPDVVAEMYGFSSGDELVRKIIAAGSEAAVIEGLTDQRMLERYGDLVDEKALDRAAEEAVHNEARARFVASELKYLSRVLEAREPTKAGGTVNILAKAAREFAAQIIARKKLRDIKPSQFAAAEARAGKAAAEAMGEGISQLVAVEKRNQLVNNYAVRAAQDAVEEIEKGVRFLRKFERDGTRKNLDSEYLDQIDQLLERFDLRPATGKEVEKRAALVEWVEEQRALGFEPTIDGALLREANHQHYTTMTLEEFRGLVDAVKNVEHLGRLKKKLLTAKDEREFATVVDELAKSVVDNATGTVKERRASDRGPLVSIGKLFRNFMADHRKFASLAREMDGWKDAGPMWERLVRTMNDAGSHEATEREKATIKLGELFSPILKAGKLGKKMFVQAVGKTFTREERLGIALNMGNEVNVERVMAGEKWTRAHLNAVLDTLTAEEWKFVQGVWDYLESFRPEIAAKSKRVTGVEPDWVEAQPVVTKHGTFRGGYYPIKYDPLRSSKAEADTAAEVQRQMERGLYVRAQTRRGHLEARVKSTGRPMRYDLGVVTQHVDQVVHDLAWHEWLIDANRLLRAAALDGAIRDHYGPEKLRTMRDTLRDIAIGDIGAQTAGDAVLTHMRHGATIVGLGWRLTTALLQPIGLTQSVVRVGAKWMARGAMHWAGDAAMLESSFGKIGEKSDFMRLRGKTMQREINEIRNKVSGQDSKLEASYFYLIQKMQLVADVPTWWGAYEKAMHENGMNESKAVALADQAVIDAQGGGQIKDLAAVQRGSAAWKLFTNFYSFFNTTYNLTREAVGRTNFKSVKDVGLLAVDLALLYTVPALLGTVLKTTLKGEWDDEDRFYRRLIADQISYMLGTVVVLRELGAVAQAGVGLPGGDYQGPASVRLFVAVAKLAKQAEQGEADEAFWKALNESAGLVFHYPAGQINATLSGLYALGTGETKNPGALVSGAPSH